MSPKLKLYLLNDNFPFIKLKNLKSYLNKILNLNKYVIFFGIYAITQDNCPITRGGPKKIVLQGQAFRGLNLKFSIKN